MSAPVGSFETEQSKKAASAAHTHWRNREPVEIDMDVWYPRWRAIMASIYGGE